MGSILDDGESSFLWDVISSDHKTAAGVEVNFYSVNKMNSIIDPLYGEFVKRSIDGPWKIFAIARWVKRAPISGEAGYTVEFDGRCTISRVHLEEKNASYPSEGDILEFWRTPY